MRSKLKTIVFMLVVSAVYTGVASGEFAVNIDTSKISFTNTASTTKFYGWNFTTSDIHITHVGLYDENNIDKTPNPDGLRGTYKIAIWKLDGTTWTLMQGFPVQISDGSSSTAINNHQYVEIPGGVDLSAGTYFIAFWRISTGQYEYDYLLLFGPASWRDIVTQNPAININYQSSAPIPTGNPDPATWPIPGDIGSATHYGVNFQFTANQPPVAADDTATTEAGSSVTIDVLANDYDSDNDTLSVTNVTTPLHGTAVINPDNTVTYTANVNFVGTDTFGYTISDGRGGTATATVTITVVPKEVAIDIKPGSYPNAINLGSNGVVPVGILSSEGFDATTVAPETMFLAGAGVAIRGKGNRYLAHEEDVNGDGLMDLVVQVETENLDPGQFQDGYAMLTGATYGGQAIEGMDEITIVPP